MRLARKSDQRRVPALLPRRQGIGGQLVQNALAELAAVGITRTTIHVFSYNDEGKAFWLSHGWTDRSDLSVLQYIPLQPQA